MTDQIVLKLGEYGEIYVESVGRVGEESGKLVQTGVTDEAKKIFVNVKEVLQNPLSGLGKAIAATLPDLDTGAGYQLDEFSVEFNIGLAVEIGADVGAVAKLTPNGAYKCSYTWKRKPNPD